MKLWDIRKIMSISQYNACAKPKKYYKYESGSNMSNRARRKKMRRRREKEWEGEERRETEWEGREGGREINGCFVQLGLPWHGLSRRSRE